MVYVRCVLTSLIEGLFVGPSVCPMSIYQPVFHLIHPMVAFHLSCCRHFENVMASPIKNNIPYSLPNPFDFDGCLFLNQTFDSNIHFLSNVQWPTMLSTLSSTYHLSFFPPYP